MHNNFFDGVLEPLVDELQFLTNDKDSSLQKRIDELRKELKEPIIKFENTFKEIQEKINQPYKKIFNTSSIELSISLDNIISDFKKILLAESGVCIIEENNTKVKWDVNPK